MLPLIVDSWFILAQVSSLVSEAPLGIVSRELSYDLITLLHRSDLYEGRLVNVSEHVSHIHTRPVPLYPLFILCIRL